MSGWCDLCRCGHPRHLHVAVETRDAPMSWGDCSQCSCSEFTHGAIEEKRRRIQDRMLLPSTTEGVQRLLMVELLEHQREVQRLDLIEKKAKVRKAEVELETAERIHELLYEHDRLVELPDIGGKPS